MIEVVVVGEGLTEESFVRDVLAPAFAWQGLLLQPRLIPTSRGGKGGALTRDRVLRYLRNTLRERGDVYVTTLFDLYGLDVDFPGLKECAWIRDPLVRAAAIEAQFAEEVVREAGCRPDRFIPYIQPHEFESLLFSDIPRLLELEPEWQTSIEELQSARAAALSPEYINDGAETHPSARLKKLMNPRYSKPLHGAAIAVGIGLDRIRADCAHFADWLMRIESLPRLRVVV